MKKRWDPNNMWAWAVILVMIVLSLYAALAVVMLVQWANW